MPHAPLPSMLQALLALTTAQPCQSSASEVGWNWRVPPNEASGPWRDVFRSRDPEAEGWNRTPGHPGVVALRERLLEQNCIRGLEVLSPRGANYSSRAARAFRRDGFVVVEDSSWSRTL
mmetsp:Transcript_106834/g.340232  ORF Transcript_106834/g.340232 Transcript_106834/m.340232 type:complete len:119 (-) Transcript_106834:921-1277(-)